MTTSGSPWHPLRPFEQPAGPVRRLEASADVLTRPGEAPQLQLRYRLQGLAGLRLPEPSSTPSRRDELWQHTCFEAFVGRPDHNEYWEFNLSPSGDWAAYRFLAYRQGLQQESCYRALPFVLDRPEPNRHLRRASLADAQVEHQTLEHQTLELSCCVLLPPGLHGARQLQIGLTAVLEFEPVSGLESELPVWDRPVCDRPACDQSESKAGSLSYWALEHPGSQADFHDRRGWTKLLSLAPAAGHGC